jgi:hypothetical protein
VLLQIVLKKDMQSHKNLNHDINSISKYSSNMSQRKLFKIGRLSKLLDMGGK